MTIEDVPHSDFRNVVGKFTSHAVMSFTHHSMVKLLLWYKESLIF